MSAHRQLFLPLMAAALLCGCASKWVDDQEAAEARAAAGPQVQRDPRDCPKLNLGTIVLDACCAADGMCGGDGTKVGYGCSSLADPMFRSFLSNPPDPKECKAGAGPAAGSGGDATKTSSPSGANPAQPGSSTGAPPAASGSSSGGTGGSQPSGSGGAGGSADEESSSGTADASMCPSVMAFGMTIQPCCTSENHCGADGSAMGFGCTDLGDAMFRMIAGSGVPPAQTCDGMPL